MRPSSLYLCKPVSEGENHWRVWSKGVRGSDTVEEDSSGCWAEKRLEQVKGGGWWSRGEGSGTSREAGSSLALGGKRGGGEKWSDSGLRRKQSQHNLVMIRCRAWGKEESTMTYKIATWVTGRMELPFPEITGVGQAKPFQVTCKPPASCKA